MTPHRLLDVVEFAPADSAAFEELVQRLAPPRKRTYVEREVDVYALLARHALTRAIAQEAMVGEGAGMVP